MPFKPVLAVTVLLASATGIGTYTFTYAEGTAYLSSDPAACANCHVMEDHYSAWLKSSHHAVATCQNCHTPPGSFVEAYTNKAVNGFLHSSAFTTGDHPYPLRIREFNAEVVEAACRSCHGPITEHVDDRAEPLSCLQCHARVGHWVR